MKKIYFCDTCHKPINVPNMKNVTVEVTGSLILKCGSCKKGKVVIKGSKIKTPKSQT